MVFKLESATIYFIGQEGNKGFAEGSDIFTLPSDFNSRATEVIKQIEEDLLWIRDE